MRCDSSRIDDSYKRESFASYIFLLITRIDRIVIFFRSRFAPTILEMPGSILQRHLDKQIVSKRL